jgi:hypothetical protein
MADVSSNKGAQDKNLPDWIPSTVHDARWGWGTLERAWTCCRGGCHIVCQGTKIKTVINGVTVADYDGAGRLDDETHRADNVGMKGHIALQIHSGRHLLIRFKDIELRELE